MRPYSFSNNLMLFHGDEDWKVSLNLEASTSDQCSGIARNFWVMGRFPANLFRGLGNNGQLKINWAKIFLKMISITKTYIC
jgi:hypothetical protein